MLTAEQLLTAAEALYPRRLYDDNSPSSQNSLVLAATTDWRASTGKSPWIDGDTILHPAYGNGANAALFLAISTLRETAFSTPDHRAIAEIRAAKAIVQHKLRGIGDRAKVAKVCHEAAATV